MCRPPSRSSSKTQLVHVVLVPVVHGPDRAGREARQRIGPEDRGRALAGLQARDDGVDPGLRRPQDGGEGHARQAEEVGKVGSRSRRAAPRPRPRASTRSSRRTGARRGSAPPSRPCPRPPASRSRGRAPAPARPCRARARAGRAWSGRRRSCPPGPAPSPAGRCTRRGSRPAVKAPSRQRASTREVSAGWNSGTLPVMSMTGASCRALGLALGLGELVRRPDDVRAVVGHADAAADQRRAPARCAAPA